MKVFRLLHQPSKEQSMNEQQQHEPRILKVNTCSSLSGRTSITYHVGCVEAQDVCFRIWDTSGKGVFSKEWVTASDIQKVLSQHERITGPSLLPIFKKGRSVNTAGYLLAVLREEGLAALSPDMPHKYVRVQSEAFVAEVAALIKKGVNLDPSEAASSGKPKTRRSAALPAWEIEAQKQQVKGE
jgi:hypothetical protein